MANPFDASTITRFQNNAEDDFASERPCIIDRVSLQLVAGTPVYNLPSYCISIRRMTYLGWKVYPLPHRELRNSYVSGTQQSRPYWYIFNNVGQAQVRLFPVPSFNLAAQVATPGTTLFDQPYILNGFIIEFFRAPDYTMNIIPPFYRTNIINAYQNYRSFAMEGQWQNMKASKYYYDKWNRHKSRAAELLDDLNNKPRNLVAAGTSQRPYGFLPPPPLLPVSANSPSHGQLIYQGIPVDDITG